MCIVLFTISFSSTSLPGLLELRHVHCCDQMGITCTHAFITVSMLQRSMFVVLFTVSFSSRSLLSLPGRLYLCGLMGVAVHSEMEWLTV